MLQRKKLRNYALKSGQQTPSTHSSTLETYTRSKYAERAYPPDLTGGSSNASASRVSVGGQY
ncbi:hypothetical protein T11_3106 [Trichinella zimbabwensis]|uniref:Uncharacterized protein n=1 Tax=Trichinella zimbabwensis TaxID=268475 RepID=A0A0V1GN70_9BILA|nr:hypothetical protein T11_3106 [Trichinella zimbabwensis]